MYYLCKIMSCALNKNVTADRAGLNVARQSIEKIGVNNKWPGIIIVQILHT